eukprot:tig00020903_g15128.t1
MVHVDGGPAAAPAPAAGSRWKNAAPVHGREDSLAILPVNVPDPPPAPPAEDRRGLAGTRSEGTLHARPAAGAASPFERLPPKLLKVSTAENFVWPSSWTVVPPIPRTAASDDPWARTLPPAGPPPAPAQAAAPPPRAGDEQPPASTAHGPRRRASPDPHAGIRRLPRPISTLNAPARLAQPLPHVQALLDPLVPASAPASAAVPSRNHRPVPSHSPPPPSAPHNMPQSAPAKSTTVSPPRGRALATLLASDPSPQPTEFAEFAVPPTMVPEHFHVVVKSSVPPTDPELAPNTEYDPTDGQWHTNIFPARVPASRRDVELLAEWTERVLRENGFLTASPPPGAVPPARDPESVAEEARLLEIALHEVVRQESVHCAERGRFLQWVARRYRALLAAALGRFGPALGSPPSPGPPPSAAGAAGKRGSIPNRKRSVSLAVAKPPSSLHADAELARLQARTAELEQEVRLRVAEGTRLKAELEDRKLLIQKLALQVEEKASAALQYAKEMEMLRLAVAEERAEVLRREMAVRLKEKQPAEARLRAARQRAAADQRALEQARPAPPRLGRPLGAGPAAPAEGEAPAPAPAAGPPGGAPDTEPDLDSFVQRDLLAERDEEIAKLLAEIADLEKNMEQLMAQLKDAGGDREGLVQRLAGFRAPAVTLETETEVTPDLAAAWRRDAEAQTGLELIPGLDKYVRLQRSTSAYRKWASAQSLVATGVYESQEEAEQALGESRPTSRGSQAAAELDEEPTENASLTLPAIWQRRRSTLMEKVSETLLGMEDEMEAVQQLAERPDVPKERVPRIAASLEDRVQKLEEVHVQIGDALARRGSKRPANAEDGEAQTEWGGAEMEAAVAARAEADELQGRVAELEAALAWERDPERRAEAAAAHAAEYSKGTQTAGGAGAGAREAEGAPCATTQTDWSVFAVHIEGSGFGSWEGTMEANVIAASAEELQAAAGMEDDHEPEAEGEGEGDEDELEPVEEEEEEEEAEAGPRARKRTTRRRDRGPKPPRVITGEAPQLGQRAHMSFLGWLKKAGLNAAVVRGKPMRMKKLAALIGDIYFEKLEADRNEDAKGRSSHLPMTAFLMEYFLAKFGLRALAEQHLSSFFASVVYHQDKSTIADTMARFMQVHPTASLSTEALDVYLAFYDAVSRSAAGQPLKDSAPEKDGRHWVSAPRVVDAARHLIFDPPPGGPGAAASQAPSPLPPALSGPPGAGGGAPVGAVAPAAAAASGGGEHAAEAWLANLAAAVRARTVKATDGGREVQRVDLNAVLVEWVLADLRLPDGDVDAQAEALFFEADAEGRGGLFLNEFGRCLYRLNPALTRLQIVRMFKEAMIASGAYAGGPGGEAGGGEAGGGLVTTFVATTQMPLAVFTRCLKENGLLEQTARYPRVYYEQKKVAGQTQKIQAQARAKDGGVRDVLTAAAAAAAAAAAPSAPAGRRASQPSVPPDRRKGGLVPEEPAGGPRRYSDGGAMASGPEAAVDRPRSSGYT